jgi:tRNA threonylcarbamoyl adenosine modification protein YjeE
MTESMTHHVALDDLPSFATQYTFTLKAGMRVCLTGDLGSGKTTFLYHVMQALGLKQDFSFSSPTFSLLNHYQTEKFAVNHMDLYRLGNFEEFVTLDLFTELQRADVVNFVEWGNKFPELMTTYDAFLEFSYDPSNVESRIIKIFRS